MITAAQIQFGFSFIQGFLYGAPHEQDHPAESIEAGIGATILISDDVSERQRDDAGNRRPVFR